jgi:hypothetical protein
LLEHPQILPLQRSSEAFGKKEIRFFENIKEVTVRSRVLSNPKMLLYMESVPIVSGQAVNGTLDSIDFHST